MLQYVTPHVPIAAGPINEKSVMDKKTGAFVSVPQVGRSVPVKQMTNRR